MVPPPGVRGAGALQISQLTLLCLAAALVSFFAGIQANDGLQSKPTGELDAGLLQAAVEQQDIVSIRRTFKANWHRSRSLLDMEEEQVALSSVMMDSGPLAAADTWPSEFADGDITAGRELLAAAKKPPPVRKPPARAKAPAVKKPAPPQAPSAPPPPLPPPPAKTSASKKP